MTTTAVRRCRWAPVIVALGLLSGGCRGEAKGIYVIGGRVIAGEGIGPPTVVPSHATLPPEASPLAGARIYMSADAEGTQLLTPVAVSDEQGRFTLQFEAPQVPYWFVVEHPECFRYTNDVFDFTNPDHKNMVVLMVYRAKKL
jgi:hypothetical protein